MLVLNLLFSLAVMQIVQSRGSIVVASGTFGGGEDDPDDPDAGQYFLTFAHLQQLANFALAPDAYNREGNLLIWRQTKCA